MIIRANYAFSYTVTLLSLFQYLEIFVAGPIANVFITSGALFSDVVCLLV